MSGVNSVCPYYEDWKDQAIGAQSLFSTPLWGWVGGQSCFVFPSKACLILRLSYTTSKKERRKKSCFVSETG